MADVVSTPKNLKKRRKKHESRHITEEAASWQGTQSGRHLAQDGRRRDPRRRSVRRREEHRPEVAGGQEGGSRSRLDRTHVHRLFVRPPRVREGLRSVAASSPAQQPHP